MGTPECKGRFHIDGRLWPPQIEAGYVTVAKEGDQCVEIVNGLRIGGVTTFTSHLRGVAVGLFNISEYVEGVEIGLVNRGRDTRGLSVGLWNSHAKAHRGVAVGLVNTGGNLYGFDIGLLANNVERDMEGFQVSIFANIADRNLRGFQLAFGGNRAEHSTTGFQAAGILNATRCAWGNSLALFNITDRCQGPNLIFGGSDFCIFGPTPIATVGRK